MDQKFYDAMADCPIIAAVKNEEGVEKCLNTDVRIVFILFGNICSIKNVTERVKSAGKIALVHIDLIEGLGEQDFAADFIKENTKADGIISTRLNLINRARELGLYTVYRIFLIDSRAFQSIERQKYQIKADFIEILPGIMPKVIRKITDFSKQPIIAGGLISDKEDVMEALMAGAISVSTTKSDIWCV
ncbi:glycerol-3-phosphate responsive antiterminator [Clostridium sp. Marseille-P2415]|uniref:glycerol-3-phosphate responsive antiterminator n=1 Tax=Clostridium sp. Marseille-P2415 TaxID=1805471 RepID=UPI0009885E7D|nr:glycerol-3-phosphate responsive antiterminator [Clostridium sp. Marseille-P2415]